MSFQMSILKECCTCFAVHWTAVEQNGKRQSVATRVKSDRDSLKSKGTPL